jgi:hypothetical protein
MQGLDSARRSAAVLPDEFNRSGGLIDQLRVLDSAGLIEWLLRQAVSD